MIALGSGLIGSVEVYALRDRPDRSSARSGASSSCPIDLGSNQREGERMTSASGILAAGALIAAAILVNGALDRSHQDQALDRCVQET